MNEKLPFLVIGHRGCAGVVPENTLSSVWKALQTGCKMIEIDVHLVEDELVVIHDFSVDRTTNGTGSLSDIPLKELRELDAGNGDKVPFLCEVLELCKDRAAVNIELKGGRTAGFTVNLLQARGAADDVVISSFDWEMLKRVRVGDPNVALAVLVNDAEKLGDALELALQLDAVSVNPSIEIVSRGFVEQVQDAGLQVAVFTVRSEKDARKVLELGADACFADDPQMVISTLDL